MFFSILFSLFRIKAAGGGGAQQHCCNLLALKPSTQVSIPLPTGTFLVLLKYFLPLVLGILPFAPLSRISVFGLDPLARVDSTAFGFYYHVSWFCTYSLYKIVRQKFN